MNEWGEAAESMLHNIALGALCCYSNGIRSNKFSWILNSGALRLDDSCRWCCCRRTITFSIHDLHILPPPRPVLSICCWANGRRRNQAGRGGEKIIISQNQLSRELNFISFSDVVNVWSSIEICYWNVLSLAPATAIDIGRASPCDDGKKRRVCVFSINFHSQLRPMSSSVACQRQILRTKKNRWTFSVCLVLLSWSVATQRFSRIIGWWKRNLRPQIVAAFRSKGLQRKLAEILRNFDLINKTRKIVEWREQGRSGCAMNFS